MTHRTLVALVLPLLLFAGCGGSAAVPGSAADTPSAPSSRAAPTRFAQYVALGDSYTAAPYVPQTDLARGCLRSNANYPQRLAEALRVTRLIDRSCSGASTSDLVQRRRTFNGLSVPPQVSALSPSTDLVTLGIGGNDSGLFGKAFTVCGREPRCPIVARLPDFEKLVDGIGPRLRRALVGVRRDAPNATVLLVGYPKIFPDEKSCAALPKLDPAQLDAANALGRRLNEVMRRTAREAGAGFVDVYAASRGHDVCAAVPWVNGTLTDTSAALALHPFAREQAAVARLIERQLAS